MGRTSWGGCYRSVSRALNVTRVFSLWTSCTGRVGVVLSSSSSSRAPLSAMASSSSVLLTSESSSYSPSDSDVITKRRGVWDDESRPVCVWPSVGMGGGGLP